MACPEDHGARPLAGPGVLLRQHRGDEAARQIVRADPGQGNV
jgi:hypothetical protein